VPAALAFIPAINPSLAQEAPIQLESSHAAARSFLRWSILVPQTLAHPAPSSVSNGRWRRRQDCASPCRAHSPAANLCGFQHWETWLLVGEESLAPERTASPIHSKRMSFFFKMAIRSESGELCTADAESRHSRSSSGIRRIACLTPSRRHRHWRRPAPCFPSSKPRPQTCCHVAWRRCRCGPSPIHRRDAALRAAHRSCLLRP